MVPFRVLPLRSGGVARAYGVRRLVVLSPPATVKVSLSHTLDMSPVDWRKNYASRLAASDDNFRYKCWVCSNTWSVVTSFAWIYSSGSETGIKLSSSYSMFVCSVQC